MSNKVADEWAETDFDVSVSPQILSIERDSTKCCPEPDDRRVDRGLNSTRRLQPDIVEARGETLRRSTPAQVAKLADALP